MLAKVGMLGIVGMFPPVRVISHFVIKLIGVHHDHTPSGAGRVSAIGFKPRARQDSPSVLPHEVPNGIAIEPPFSIDEMLFQRFAHGRIAWAFGAFLVAFGFVGPANRLATGGRRALERRVPGHQQRSQLDPDRVAVLDGLASRQRVGFIQPNQRGSHQSGPILEPREVLDRLLGLVGNDEGA